MTKIVKAGGFSELLGLVPNLLGYTPENSIVAIVFKGTLTVGALRVDHPDSGDEGSDTVDDVDMACVAIAGVITRAVQERGDGVVILAYNTDDSERALQMISLIVEAGLVNVLNSAVISPRGWHHPGGPHYETTAPTDLDLPDTSRPMVGHDLVGDPLPSDTYITTAYEATADLKVRIDTLALTPFVDSILTTWVDDATLSNEAVSTLALIFELPSLRDTAILTFAVGPEIGAEAEKAQILWVQGVPYPEHLARVMWGEGYTPGIKRLEAAHAMLHRAASLTPDFARAGLLSGLAWFSWATGRSSEAMRWANDTVALEPEHGLATIVKGYVNSGHFPAWILP